MLGNLVSSYKVVVTSHHVTTVAYKVAPMDSAQYFNRWCEMAISHLPLPFPPSVLLPSLSSPWSSPLRNGSSRVSPRDLKNLYGCRRDLVQVFSKTRTYKTNKNSAEISFVWVLFTSSMMWFFAKTQNLYSLTRNFNDQKLWEMNF